MAQTQPSTVIHVVQQSRRLENQDETAKVAEAEKDEASNDSEEKLSSVAEAAYMKLRHQLNQKSRSIGILPDTILLRAVNDIQDKEGNPLSVQDLESVKKKILVWRRTYFKPKRKEFVYSMCENYFNGEDLSTLDLVQFAEDIEYLECVQSISALFASHFGGSTRATAEEKALVSEYISMFLEDKKKKKRLRDFPSYETFFQKEGTVKSTRKSKQSTVKGTQNSKQATN